MEKTTLKTRGQQIIYIYRDREYFRRLFKIALPIILQSFITSSLSMVGVIMIGQLGETAVAGVGLANQIFFLLNLFLFGVSSGSAIFTAQLWGKEDVANIRKVLGLSLAIGLTGSAVFAAIAIFSPQAAMSVYSEDPAVVSLGGEYLQIFGFSFFFMAVTFSFASVLRSIGDVRTPLLVSICALSFNTLLSYGLIFGNFGLPALGVRGAAISVCAARVLEASVLVLVTYLRRSPAAASLRDWRGIDRKFASRVLRRVLPVTFNEILWSFGITTYNIVYARIGTESIAAMNIAVTVDNLALVFFIGIAQACAILVGNWIGANEEQKAFHYAWRTLSLGAGGALLMGLVIIAGADRILSLYKVSPTVTQYAHNILTVIALLLWLRVSNLILFVGIFRSGGDTRFAFFLDAGVIWLVGVPLAVAGAFLFHLPIYLVYLMVMTEELVKWIVGVFRFFSKKWIHNLAQGM